MMWAAGSRRAQFTIRLVVSRAVALLAMAGAAGCGEPPESRVGDPWAGTVDTLESGRIIVSNPDVGLWGEGEGLRLIERFRLGALYGEGPDVFGEIRAVTLGLDGHVFVLDGQANEVRMFGRGGEFIRTLGRSGEGPGELKAPAGMTLDAADRVWIMDWGNARYSAFDPGSGEVVDERPRFASFTAIPWPGRFNASGRLLDMGLGRGGEPVILLLDSAYVPHDTPPLPQPDDRHAIVFRRGDVPVMRALLPFAPRPAWAPHSRGGIVVGEGETYRLHHIGFRGDTTMTVEVDRAPERVSRAERDSALAAFEEMSQQAAGAVPDRQPRIPGTKPAHGAVFVDDQGWIWVRRTPGRETADGWDVLDEDGRFLGQVAIPITPGPVRPSVRGGWMAIATSLDEVPTVVIYEMVGGGVDTR